MGSEMLLLLLSLLVDEMFVQIFLVLVLVKMFLFVFVEVEDMLL